MRNTSPAPCPPRAVEPASSASRPSRARRKATATALDAALIADLVVAVNERGVAAVSRDAFVSRPTIYRAMSGATVHAVVRRSIEAAVRLGAVANDNPIPVRAAL